MKKILPFILILSIFVNLFTPFAIIKAAPGDEANTTTATNENGTSNETKTTTTSEDYSSALDIKISRTDKQIYVKVLLKEDARTEARDFFKRAGLYIKAWLVKDGKGIPPEKDRFSLDFNDIEFQFKNLDANTEYTIFLTIFEQEIVDGGVQMASGVLDPKNILKLGPYTTTTNPTDVTAKIDDEQIIKAEINKTQDIMPKCGLFNLDGCGAQILYGLFFVPTSFLFALAGTFFDNTFAYSVNSDSYTNPFVTKGWGLMRDFCNMFFIFVLVYIAIGTILQLNSIKTKDMMISVVVIGIFINFSLFAAQVVIDTSNIMARVFYNSETIRISKGEKTGITDAANTTAEVSGAVAGAVTGTDLNSERRQTPSYINGVIPLSEALVNKINPQNLILNAGKVGKLPNKGGQQIEESSQGSVSTGTFVLVTLLATAVNIVGMIVFLSVGLIFVTRVVGLWVAMILAPVAFFTYMVPYLQNKEMIGWKNWWANIINLSFLAPIFMFFLYLILQFLESGLGIIENENSSGINFVLGIMIPFIFIMVLLMKAKSIAVKMSGQWGEAVSKIGANAGGLAVGAMTGGAAMLGRATVGRMGSSIANSETVKKWAGSKNMFSKFAGNKIMDAGQSVGKKSFDFRNTKAGAGVAKGLGADLGKGKTGGYTKDRKDEVEKKQKRAEEIKVGEDEPLNQAINKAEMDLQKSLNTVIEDFNNLDRSLVIQRQIRSDNANSTDPLVIAEFDKAVKEIARLLQVKKDIKSADGRTFVASAAATTPDELNAIRKAFDAANKNGGRSINVMESQIIPNAKKAKEIENRGRTTNFANNTAFWGTRAGKEAQHKIIMGSKIES